VTGFRSASRGARLGIEIDQGISLVVILGATAPMGIGVAEASGATLARLRSVIERRKDKEVKRAVILPIRRTLSGNGCFKVSAS